MVLNTYIRILSIDLKPENIMVDTTNMIFKIIDFGLSFLITKKINISIFNPCARKCPSVFPNQYFSTYRCLEYGMYCV